MNRWTKPVAILGGILVFVIAVAWIKYLQQRPLPPEWISSSQTRESGDTLDLQWVPAKTGPQPETYQLEESRDQNFTPAQLYASYEIFYPKQELSIVLPRVPPPTTTHYFRLKVKNKAKLSLSSDTYIWSDPSNVLSISIKALPNPTLSPLIPNVSSGEDYTISWPPVNKANHYKLKETSPIALSHEIDVLTTSITLAAPPLDQDMTFSYCVTAGIVMNGMWTPITYCSDEEGTNIKHVVPPTNLKVIPSSAYNPQPYAVSWGVPPNGPLPISSYGYSLRETVQSQAPNLLPTQTQTSYTTTAPAVTSSQTITYEVMAYFGKNPMTNFSTPVNITINPPPALPPPPKPQIGAVDPVVAPKGDPVTVTGINFSGATVELYSSTMGKSIQASPLTSLTATQIVFQVPQGASLKTTSVRVSTGSGQDEKPFQVARQPGPFVERQGDVGLQTENCTQFSKKVDLPCSYLNQCTGRFLKSGTKLVDLQFTATVVNLAKSGLGFSQNCNVGVLVAASKGGIVQPVFVNFYNLNHKQDSATQPGQMISGPNGFDPSMAWTEGYKLLFSPDDTIAAVIERDATGLHKFRVYFIDMLGGKFTNSLFSFDSATFTSVVGKTNKISFDAGFPQPTVIDIPIP